MFPSRPSLMLAAACALSLAACGRAPEGEVRVVAVDAVTGEQMLDAALAQGLVRFDAAGEIEQGLASSWHVSDDGRSYIFRLADTNWADGDPVNAPAVAHLLEDRLADPAFADEFGAIEAVRAMTDKVIEIRLAAPQRNFLQLLARPELTIGTQANGTGPFTRIAGGEDAGSQDGTRVGRLVQNPRGELVEERVRVEVAAASEAVTRFAAGEADLVTGGTFATAPLALATSTPFGRPRFDPVAGIFGLVPQAAEGPLATPELRRALSAAIDRHAIIAALGVRSLLPRATVLQSALDMDVRPRPPAFVDQPLAERQAAAREALADAQLEDGEIRLALPEGPGADLLFTRLVADWGAIGLTPVRADPEQADLVLIDYVAPAANSSWFLRQFRCERVTICDAEADRLLDAARAERDPARRIALLAEAAARIEEAQLFMPIAAPVRWSLVAPGLTGFAENRFARHFIGGLREPRRR